MNIAHKNSIARMVIMTLDWEYSVTMSRHSSVSCKDFQSNVE